MVESFWGSQEVSGTLLDTLYLTFSCGQWFNVNGPLSSLSMVSRQDVGSLVMVNSRAGDRTLSCWRRCLPGSCVTQMLPASIQPKPGCCLALAAYGH